MPEIATRNKYDCEPKEELKEKHCAIKETNITNLPWLLTGYSLQEKCLKQYRGLKEDIDTTDSSYYVFTESKDGIEAYPVEDWYTFTEKKLEQENKNEDKLDFDHDDDVSGIGSNFKQHYKERFFFSYIDENEEKHGKTTGDDLFHVVKLLKNNIVNILF